MSFLGQLADQISSQFSLGENTNNTMNSVIDGTLVKYGTLGDTAKNIDQSAERRYVEEGYLRRDPYNTNPKQFEILMQEPSATVLIKKKMFSSLAQNFRPDFMDSDEALYFKAVKVLFANKCRQISSLEQLSKIAKVSNILGQLDTAMIPLLITLTDSFTNGFGDGTNFWGTLGKNNPYKDGEMSAFVQVVNTLRRNYAFNMPNQYTTWITDITNTLQSKFGEGTGVIELNTVSNFGTSVGVELGSGACNFTIADPYQATLITEYDIEVAIADASNAFYNHKMFQLGKENADKLINDLQNKLNTYRAQRKASPITFRINPDTLLGKRVTAIIDRVGLIIPFTYDSTSAASIFSGGLAGGGVTIAPEYLKDGAVAGYDGLSTEKNKFFAGDSTVLTAIPESELSIFQKLIKAIFSKLSLMANSINAFQTTNDKTNYARRKLRFNFLGKLMIQPMDVVHLYINSKTSYDNKLLSGLNNMFSGLGILQNLNNTLTDVKNSFDVFNAGESVNFQAEKWAMVGPKFPNFLWAMIRRDFMDEKEGVHVFAGVVNNSSDSWYDGKYSVSVNCQDQSAYFSKGKINFNPGTDVFNGNIYDPLTPFKTNFDSITSNMKQNTPILLDENKFLLSEDGSSALIKHKQGPAIGTVATEKNLVQDQHFSPTTATLTKNIYLPDGLVYKWKEGIGVLVQFGEAALLNQPQYVGIPNLMKDPFAGQDIMNVISLLITGYPYNFITYWNATLKACGMGRDATNQQDAAYTYMESLQSALVKNNVLWGNFIPFKNLMVDDASYSKILQGQFNIINQNNDLNAKLQKLSDLKNALDVYNISSQAKNVVAKDNPDYFNVQNAAKQLQDDINNQIVKLELDTMSNQYIINVGDDVSFDDDLFLQNSGQDKNDLTNPKIRRLLRRKLNNLTRRMSYNVKANEDRNYFIVDDYYDKDYDIAAYNKALTDGIKLFSNSFTSVLENIRNTASLLNLEIFCDTQGHIRVRPPQYNRMPSSVFFRMMYLKKALKVQIFPQFMEDLFTNNVDALVTNVQVLEDQIRLYCAALGYNTDDDAIQFISTNNANALGEGEGFGFISDYQTGLISDIQTVMKIANSDNVEEFTDQQLKIYRDIELQATSSKTTFNAAYRAKILLNSVINNKLSGAGYYINKLDEFNQDTYIDTLISRIQTQTGQRIPKGLFVFDIKNISNTTINQGLKVFEIVEELSGLIAKRQKAVKSLYSTIRNASEFRYLDDNPDAANQLLLPGNYGSTEIPEVFEHMIEDESYDDLGPNSGQRYVIKRAQIKSMSFTETDPKYTSVEVQGIINEYAPSSLPSGYNTFPQGGNGLVTAQAIDYDTWRLYGISEPSPVSVPFFSDPNTQCAPYATMLLSRARKEILKGNITIVGNEFMQPGEVVFVEDRGLLYYVTSVRHNFTFGQSFTTQLDLAYGHAPGEYIPTTLDVIGKMVYNNRDTSSLVINRQSNSLKEIHFGILQKDQSNPIVINEKDSFSNKYSNDNNITIQNILYSALQLLQTTNTSENDQLAKIEIRVYYDNVNNVNSDLLTFANSARNILIGKLEVSDKNNPKNTLATVNTYFSSKDVKDIVSINMDDSTDFRCPSQKALSAARSRINDLSMSGGGASAPNANDISSSGTNTNSSTTNNINSSSKTKQQKDKLRAAIFNYIVDCYLIFEQKTTQ